MSYETACRLTVAVHDRDRDATRQLLTGFGRGSLERVAVMLAAMVSPDACAPAAVVEATARYLGVAPPGGADTLTVRLGFLTDEVATMFRVAVAELVGPSRERQATDARHVLCWLARNDGMTLTQIGGHLSRDHTTVMHAVGRVNRTPGLRAKAAILLRRESAA